MQHAGSGLSIVFCIVLTACGGGSVTTSTSTPAEQNSRSANVDLPGGIPQDYRLVWADEFDRDGLPDASRWDYDTRRNKEGWWDGKLQYFGRARMENTRIESGRLIIEARKEKLSSAPDYGGQEYSSGSITTRERASWTYFAAEMRAKPACGQGLLSAFWLLPNGMRWPQDGEIDVLESLGYAPDTAYATVHTDAFNHQRATQIGSQKQVSNACNEWHRYQTLWTTEGIWIGVDDRWHFRFQNLYGDDPSRWPFTQPFHLNLTLDVGGSWAGSKGVPDTSFPARMEVDYVRVYQK